VGVGVGFGVVDVVVGVLMAQVLPRVETVPPGRRRFPFTSSGWTRPNGSPHAASGVTPGTYP